MRKSDYELILEVTSLDGGFVCDLIGTNMPDAKWAEAAVAAASQRKMRELVRYVYQAVMEHAAATGHTPKKARLIAMLA
jgi:hypothetical protein